MIGELTATTAAARTPMRPHSIMRRFQDCGAPISVESSAMLIQSLAPRRVSAFFNYDTHDRRRAPRRSGCGGRNDFLLAALPFIRCGGGQQIDRAGLLEYPNLIS